MPHGREGEGLHLPPLPEALRVVPDIKYAAEHHQPSPQERCVPFRSR